MKRYLEYYENEWPENIAELTAVENWPFVGYLNGKEVLYTVVSKPVTEPTDNEIWYTSSDGNVVTPSEYADSAFVASIKSNTYDNGKGIITFDGSVTHIVDMAFAECFNLTSIIIPNSVTSIGYGAFGGCESLTSITIPNSVTSIGNYTFSNCFDLTSITIPNSVTSIGEATFGFCESLTSITIPNSVTSIGENAFSDCSSLTSITIPNSVTSIGENAFSQCTSLNSVTIGNSVTSIGSWAFDHCHSLTSITFQGTIEQWNTISKGDKWNYNVPATHVQCTDGQIAL